MTPLVASSGQLLPMSYAWRFQVEENFLDLKSNAFDLEASRLRDKDAPQSIMWRDCVDHAVSNATRN